MAQRPGHSGWYLLPAGLLEAEAPQGSMDRPQKRCVIHD